MCGFSSFGRARPCQGRGGGFDPRNPLQKKAGTKTSCPIFLPRENQDRRLRRERVYLVNIRRATRHRPLRRRSQAVRQRSAKPLFIGPIPIGASKKFRTRKCAEFFTFSLFTLHFSLIRRVRIFWKVIGKSEK